MKNVDKENIVNKIKNISDDELEKVSAGSDTDSLKFTGKEVPLPEAKSKKECDGGYTGKIYPKSTDKTTS